MKQNILLIHGWDYLLYTKMTKSKDAWEEYKKLTNELEKKYNIYKVNLPGFCGQDEKGLKEWNVSDFANYVEEYIKDNKIKIDYILGYSFGGAVAVKWKKKYNKNTKLILLAPAIIRNHDNSKKFINTPKLLDRLRKVLRNLYVIHIVKTNEMVYGTKFLRNSYQRIVREDLREDLFSLPSKDIILIYGDKDNAVNPNEMLLSSPKGIKERINMIKNANHDNIITEYIDEIISIINKSI